LFSNSLRNDTTIMQRKNSPTVRQLASLAGVSRTTVSLALRNHPSLPENTRQRIQTLAEQQGYRSDAVVSALMTRLRSSRITRSHDTLAFLTFGKERNGWIQHSDNDRRYYAGLKNRAEKLGYDIEVFWAKEPGLTSARLSKILHTRAIRGLILPPLLRSSGHLSLQWDYFAAAAIGYTLLKPDLHRATHSHMSGMILALRKLKQRGYQRIGFANLTGQNERVRHNWLAGYLTYQQVTRQRNPLPAFLSTQWNSQEFKKWLDKHRPDVVISNSLEPLHLLRQLAYDVPGEIGFASLDRLSDNAPYAGIDQYPEQVGAAAVDLIVAQLQNNELGLPSHPQTLQIDGGWVDGNTVRKPGCQDPSKE
jgi:LacI family transcriptional regulator